MIKVSVQTLSTTSWKKSEINMRLSDLYGNLHTVLRFIRIIILPGRHRNKYYLNLKEFNSISQSYHSSLFISKGWSSRPEVFCKKVFLEISQNSQENAYVAVSFLIKLQALACNFIKKETLAQVFSCEFFKISKYTFCYRTLPLAASERATWFSDKRLKEREKERSKEYFCGQKQYILH